MGIDISRLYYDNCGKYGNILDDSQKKQKKVMHDTIIQSIQMYKEFNFSFLEHEFSLLKKQQYNMMHEAITQIILPSCNDFYKRISNRIEYKGFVKGNDVLCYTIKRYDSCHETKNIFGVDIPIVYVSYDNESLMCNNRLIGFANSKECEEFVNNDLNKYKNEILVDINKYIKESLETCDKTLDMAIEKNSLL